MQQGDAEVPQLGRGEPLRLRLGGLRLHRLRVGYQRADHERLPPLPQPRADELIGRGAALLVHDPRR